jgi:hypothetical protein
MIYTLRHTRQSALEDRQTAGADFSLETSKFRGNQNLLFAGYYLWTTNPAKTGDSGAYGLRLEYPNELWDAQLVFREIQPNYNPAVGFLERVNHRRLHPNLTFRPRPKHNKVIRRFNSSRTSTSSRTCTIT